MCLCGLTFLQGRLHREKKTKRKKENVLNQNSLGSASMPQGENQQKEERLRKIWCGLTFSCGYFTQREEKIRIIGKFPKSNSLGSVSKSTSTERKKTKRKKYKMSQMKIL